ncbi:MAG: hypothetical protein KAJ19_29005 [Gammaproteobacteria bacterium]|nr:hypothetical protein [Gammaproteobacteria bacterium]
MAYKTLTQQATDAVTPSPIILIDRKPENFKALFHTIVTAGTPTYDVEYSINGIDFIILNNLTGLTTSQDTTMVFPVEAVRVNITAGTGTVKIVGLINNGDGNA